jgi:hypothetical protein
MAGGKLEIEIRIENPMLQRTVARDAAVALWCHAQLDPVVRCMDQILLRAKVPLGRLH